MSAGMKQQIVCPEPSVLLRNLPNPQPCKDVLEFFAKTFFRPVGIPQVNGALTDKPIKLSGRNMDMSVELSDLVDRLHVRSVPR